MTLQELGVFVRQERHRQALSALALAEQADIDRSLLSKLENQRLPELGFTKVARLLQVLGFELTPRARGGLPTLMDLQRQNTDEDAP
jgi:transcriptional regulator with XRE-family HTH domain